MFKKKFIPFLIWFLVNSKFSFPFDYVWTHNLIIYVNTVLTKIVKNPKLWIPNAKLEFSFTKTGNNKIVKKSEFVKII